MSIRYLFVLLLSFIAFSIYSQEYTVNIDEIGFEEGLIYNQINDIYEDKDGLLWIGTSKGLLRYDGEDFKVWNEEDETGQIYSISRIIQDDAGILWLWNSELSDFVFLDPSSGISQSRVSKFGDSFPNQLNGNTSSPGFAFSGSKRS